MAARLCTVLLVLAFTALAGKAVLADSDVEFVDAPFEGVPVELVDHMDDEAHKAAAGHRFKSGKPTRHDTLVITVDNPSLHVKKTPNGLRCNCPKPSPCEAPPCEAPAPCRCPKPAPKPCECPKPEPCGQPTCPPPPPCGCATHTTVLTKKAGGHHGKGTTLLTKASPAQAHKPTPVNKKPKKPLPPQQNRAPKKALHGQHKHPKKHNKKTVKKSVTRPSKPPPPATDKDGKTKKKHRKSPHHASVKRTRKRLKHIKKKLRKTSDPKRRKKLKKILKKVRKRHRKHKKKHRKHMRNKAKAKAVGHDEISRLIAKYGLGGTGKTDKHLRRMVSKLHRLEHVLRSSHESMRDLRSQMEDMHRGHHRHHHRGRRHRHHRQQSHVKKLLKKVKQAKKTKLTQKKHTGPQKWDLDIKGQLADAKKKKATQTNSKTLATSTKTMLAILHRTCAKVKAGEKRKLCAKTFFKTYKKSCDGMKSKKLKTACLARLTHAQNTLHKKATQLNKGGKTPAKGGKKPTKRQPKKAQSPLTTASVAKFCSHLKRRFMFRCIHKFGQAVHRMCRFMPKKTHRSACVESAKRMRVTARKSRAAFFKTPQGKAWRKRWQNRHGRRQKKAKKTKKRRKLTKTAKSGSSKGVTRHATTQAALINWAYNKCKKAGGKNCESLRHSLHSAHGSHVKKTKADKLPKLGDAWEKKLNKFHKSTLATSRKRCEALGKKHGHDSKEHKNCRRAHHRLRRAIHRRNKKAKKHKKRGGYPEDKYGPLVPAWFKSHKKQLQDAEDAKKPVEKKLKGPTDADKKLKKEMKELDSKLQNINKKDGHKTKTKKTPEKKADKKADSKKQKKQAKKAADKKKQAKKAADKKKQAKKAADKKKQVKKKKAAAQTKSKGKK